MNKLIFGKGNAKLDKHIYTFSLPAGYSCPYSKNCRAWVVKEGEGGRLKVRDGRNAKFRCYAASQEVLYYNTYLSRRHNFKALKKARGPVSIARLILRSIPKNATHIRIHVSGDFYSQSYFDGWLLAAMAKPKVTFYTYTKSIPFWLKRINHIPENFILTASLGGKRDIDALKNKLRTARVVYSEEEAAAFDLPIDHDDSHAMSKGGDFAILIHGTQKANTESSKAMMSLRKKGVNGYNYKF